MTSAERQPLQMRDSQTIIGGPLESILGDFLRIAEARRYDGRRARFSELEGSAQWKIEDKFVRSVVREMSISENYEGEVTPIRSNISRSSRGCLPAGVSSM
jgi:hypothetical protein